MGGVIDLQISLSFTLAYFTFEAHKTENKHFNKLRVTLFSFFTLMKKIRKTNLPLDRKIGKRTMQLKVSVYVTATRTYIVKL